MARQVRVLGPSIFFVGDGGPQVKVFISEVETDPSGATASASFIDELAGSETGSAAAGTISSIASYTNAAGQSRFRFEVAFSVPTNEAGRFASRLSVTIGSDLYSVPFWIPFRVRKADPDAT